MAAGSEAVQRNQEYDRLLAGERWLGDRFTKLGIRAAIIAPMSDTPVEIFLRNILFVPDKIHQWKIVVHVKVKDSGLEMDFDDERSAFPSEELFAKLMLLST